MFAQGRRLPADLRGAFVVSLTWAIVCNVIALLLAFLDGGVNVYVAAWCLYSGFSYGNALRCWDHRIR